MKNKGLSKFISSKSPNVSLPQGIFSSRVTHIILDDVTHPEIFKKYGGWGALGGIFFDNFTTPNPNRSFTSDNFALPLYPHEKSYPLKNELVYIISLPNNKNQSDVNSITYYYFTSINIWNNPHHNAIPDAINSSTKSNPDYELSFNNVPITPKDDFDGIDLGSTFKEKSNIKPILPYEGDRIYEGRWGNSIRFGSTVKSPKIPNPWSDSGEDGDPILIIRNGQVVEDSSTFEPNIEDINKDNSSLYLTSTQILPIEIPSNVFDSYSTPPIDIPQYNSSQGVIIADRVLLVSKEDSILLNSKKSVGVSSLEGFNVDSPESILQSQKVRLGDKDATEPIILGDKFLKDFKQLLDDLIELSTALQTPIGQPPPNVPNVQIAPKAVKVQASANKMVSIIDEYKSKISKTK